MNPSTTADVFRRLRYEVRNWFTVGVLAAITLPTRLPPRRGLAHTWLARRIVTFSLRDGSRVTARLQDAGDVVSVYIDRDYASLGVPWSKVASAIDIGATVGSFALWASKQRPNLRITAIEPNPATYEFLVKNIRANGLTDRVRAMPVAVGGQRGRGYILDPSFSTLATVEPVPTTSQVGVEVITLADVIDLVQVETVDLLKIDCEGCEYDVLLGTTDELLSRIRFIVCEYHPVPNRSVGQLQARLRRAGFDVTIVGGPVGFLVARHD